MTISQLILFLRKVRLDQGLSCRDVCARANIGNANVAAWERGQQLPSLPYLLAWIDALGVTMKLEAPRR